jgi:hypothetical protein
VTLFGRTLDGQEVASLVFMLAVLVLWVGALRGERSWAGWFRRWEAGRKARRDAEIASGRGDKPSRGPWG